MKNLSSNAGLVILSGGLLASAFPPVNLSMLAWVGFIPLLVVCERVTRAAEVWWFYLHTTVFLGIGLWWITEVTFAGLVVVVFHLGFFQLVMLAPIIGARRKLKLPYMAVAPVAWVAAEYLRSFFLGGFPWLFLSHTQWRALGLIQIADLFGAYGVTFLVVLVNAALVDLFLVSSRRKRIVVVAIPAAAIVATMAYGHFRLGQAEFEEGPRIALVQGNIPQDDKVSKRSMTREEMMDRHLWLSLKALEDPEKPDLIVWPETMIPGYLNGDVRFSSQIEDLARRHGVRVLVGSNGYEQTEEGYRKTNSCFYVDEGGHRAGRYDKHHLVPVGEYNPYRKSLPRTNEIIFATAGFLPELTPGEGPLEVELPDGDSGKSFRFSTIICFEQIFSDQVREYCLGDVDFLVLVTNDAWWNDSFEYEQFLAIGAFRAVENRVSLVRCGNTGISAFIDPSGRVGQENVLVVDGRWKNVQGVLTRNVAIDPRRSPFLVVGDLFARLCMGVLIVLSIASLYQHRRERKAARSAEAV